MNKEQREVKEWKKEDKVMLSTRNLVFKEKLVKKLTERYVKSFVVEEVILKNIVKLKLLVSMRIYPVVNVSRIMKYRELIKGQKIEEPKPIEVDGEEKWKVEKILNKIKVRGVMKYLVYQKVFTTENNIWKKEKDLENVKKLVDEFEERMNIEIK